MSLNADWPRYALTRYRHIGVSRLSPTLWRFVCLDWEGGGTSKNFPACIGPMYRTRAECLSDLNRYATENYPETVD